VLLSLSVLSLVARSFGIGLVKVALYAIITIHSDDYVAIGDLQYLLAGFILREERRKSISARIRIHVLGE
jgi:hypothetical protein